MTNKLSLLPVLTALTVANVNALEWVTTYDGSTTSGNAGTITLDDWGFTGPQGRQADSFEPHGGVFGNGLYDSMGAAYCLANPAACGIGQMQHVVTSGPDGITPDPAVLIGQDFFSTTGDFENANVDSLTTFYHWGYTSAAGSTFNNMLIDLDGDYLIAKDDMSFEWYNIIDYKQVIPDGETRIVDSNPDGIYNNGLGFQPYTVSDAKGWCGSVTASHPNAHEAMAGQVMFDIIMDVYQRKADGSLQFFSSELTPDFEMRSFGDITSDFPSTAQYMHARAVVNNTNPADPMYYYDKSAPGFDPNLDLPTIDENMPVDLAYHNKVSFMGSNVLSSGSWCGIESAEWQGGARGIGVKRYETVRRDITTKELCEAEDGGVWDYNSFPGFTYILRADAGRYIDYFDADYGPDPMADPDNDTVLNYLDNCPLTANADQADSGGVDTNIADGIGDACQCGDISGDGKITNTDSVLIKRHLLGLPTPFEPDFCDVNGDAACTNTDAVLIQRAILGLPPGLKQTCVAAGN